MKCIVQLYQSLSLSISLFYAMMMKACFYQVQSGRKSWTIQWANNPRMIKNNGILTTWIMRYGTDSSNVCFLAPVKVSLSKELFLAWKIGSWGSIIGLAPKIIFWVSFRKRILDEKSENYNWRGNPKSQHSRHSFFPWALNIVSIGIFRHFHEHKYVLNYFKNFAEIFLYFCHLYMLYFWFFFLPEFFLFLFFPTTFYFLNILLPFFFNLLTFI